MDEKGLLWFRKSKGEEQAIGFEQRKAAVRELAEEVIGDNYDELDLGIHTGFSIHHRDRDAKRIDSNPDVIDALDRIEDGEYDYIFAYDDKRVARDEYFYTIERKAKLGEAPFVFVRDDIDRDDLSFNLKREVARHQKREEIQDAREAVQERIQQGYWQGPAPFGTQHNSCCEPPGLSPTEEFEDVLNVLRSKNEGASNREALDTVGLVDTHRNQVTRILDHVDVYRAVAENFEDYDWEHPETADEIREEKATAAD